MTGFRGALWAVGAPARALLVGIIHVYRATLSGLLGGQHCRFYPSCSHYAEEAIRLHGATKGSMLAAWRLLRCNPYGPWGIDHVPLRPTGVRVSAASGMTTSHESMSRASGQSAGSVEA